MNRLGQSSYKYIRFFGINVHDINCNLLFQQMDLKYIVMTIIKILVSVPTCMLLIVEVNGAALMGGHLDNDRKNLTMNRAIYSTEPYTDFLEVANATFKSEIVPSPSSLISPGYNLPENIFNKGKPFYLEKNSDTGQIDFQNKSTYLSEKHVNNGNENVATIHQSSDVDQLIPNFHDFLNLPVHYNSDKYNYPLISNSYANTKVQGYTHEKNNKKVTFVNENISSHTPFQNTINENIKTSTAKTVLSEQVLPTRKVDNINSNFNLFDILFGNYEESGSNFYPYNTTQPKDEYKIYHNSDKNSKEGNNITTFDKEKPIFSKENNIMDDINTYEKIDHEDNKQLSSSFSAKKKLHLNYTEETSSEINSDYDYEFYDDSEDGKLEKVTTYMDYQNANENAIHFALNNNSKENIKHTNASSIIALKNAAGVTLAYENMIGIQNPDPIIVAAHNLKEKLSSEKVVQNINSSHDIQINENSFKSSPKNLQNNSVDSFKNAVYNYSLKDTETSTLAQNNNNYLFKEEINNLKIPQEKYDIRKPMQGSVKAYEQNYHKHFTLGTKEIVSEEISNKNKEIKQKLPGPTINEAAFTKDNSLQSVTETMSTEVYLQEMEAPAIIASNDFLLPKAPYHKQTSELILSKESNGSGYSQKIENKLRPPWDPRPGHFYSGNLEYIHPPRPLVAQSSSDYQYKRMDTLPNILPQFRPITGHKKNYFNENKWRPPLFEIKTNKPIEFYEKLHPPPPLPGIVYNYNNNLQINSNNMLHIQTLPSTKHNFNDNQIEDKLKKQFSLYQKPPMLVIANKRASNDENVETLQMIQSKNFDKKENSVFNNDQHKHNLSAIKDNNSSKPLYVVYPINVAPAKLDSLDTRDKNNLVSEQLSLPNVDNKFINYEKSTVLLGKEKNDSPILIPHQRVPTSESVKSDFPYPLERPTNSYNGPRFNVNKSFINDNNKEHFLMYNWNQIKLNNTINFKQNEDDYPLSNQIISATLKTLQQNPIAIAYVPTESPIIITNYEMQKFSRPNYGSSVIPEILHKKVQIKNNSSHLNIPDIKFNYTRSPTTNHISSTEEIHSYAGLNKNQENFQAPFQASINVNSMNQGWSIIRSDMEKRIQEETVETTTMQITTGSEFDIKNFKPQLEGGFKPIFNFSFSNDQAPMISSKLDDKEKL